jgi:hypothetical protein
LLEIIENKAYLREVEDLEKSIFEIRGKGH